MHERESVARELEDSPSRIESHARGKKVLEITQHDTADIIFFPEVPSSETFLEKIQTNQGLKKFVASTIIGLAAAAGATIFSGVAAKNNNHNATATESQKDEETPPNIVEINPNIDNIVTVGTTGVAPPVVITTPESESESEPEIEIDSDFAFGQPPKLTSEPALSSTPEQTVSQAPATTNETVAETYENPTTTSISNGLDIAIRTAFSEGAYSSEEEARKIADVIINRAVKNGTSIGAEVSNGEFEAYDRGVEGRGNWGWREYGSGPQNGSIGTERVQQIFMEELNKAASGQPLAYGYTGFGASGDGVTNTFR